METGSSQSSTPTTASNDLSLASTLITTLATVTGRLETQILRLSQLPPPPTPACPAGDLQPLLQGIQRQLTTLQSRFPRGLRPKPGPGFLLWAPTILVLLLAVLLLLKPTALLPTQDRMQLALGHQVQTAYSSLPAEQREQLLRLLKLRTPPKP
jgi:hypothetical protein